MLECKLCCFFFSSRRRHTRLVSDWSSDVCSSDLSARRRSACRPGGSAASSFWASSCWFMRCPSFAGSRISTTDCGEGPVELRPLDASHDALLRSLQEQDDVWEFVGSLPEREEGDAHRLFAVIEGQVAVGIGGLVKSPAFDGKDFEVLCAMRSEAQRQGLAKHACQLIL